MKKSLQLSMDLYYIGMILYLYGMKQYHICMESYSVKLCLTVRASFSRSEDKASERVILYWPGSIIIHTQTDSLYVIT